MSYQRGVRPDYMVGTITLLAGEVAFTTNGASLQTATVQGGDTIMTADGRSLIIRKITGQNEGELFYPCPADVAGTDLPLHIRFQSSGSGLQGAMRDLIARWGGTGNVDAFAALEGVLGGVPVFSAFGMEVVSLDDIQMDDPHQNLAQLAALAKANNQFIVMGADGSVTLKPISDLFAKPTGTVNQFLRGDGSEQTIVGTVAAAGGGAIIQRGSNANGNFERLEGGKQTCWTTIMAGVTTATVGSLFMTPGMTWTFPASFASRPVVGGSCYKISGAGVTMLGGPLGNTTTTAVSNVRGISTHNDSDAELFLIAEGWWK